VNPGIYLGRDLEDDADRLVRESATSNEPCSWV